MRRCLPLGAQVSRLGNNILDSPANQDVDPDLDRLVQEIFNIIPSYYDENEARKIKQLISEYVIRKLRQGK